MMKDHVRNGRVTRLVIISALALVAAIPFAAQSQPSPQGGWQFELTPYAWLAGMSGDVGSGASETHTSASFTDIARELDSALMLHFEVRKGRWGFFLDPFYINLGDTVMTPYGFKLSITTKQLLLGLEGSYRAYQKDGRSLDILFGGRYNELKTDLTPLATPYPPYHFEKDWVDPLVGFRARFDLGHGWAFGFRGDIGGFDVGSRLTWDAIARFDVRASKCVAFNFGYAVVSTDYESGEGASRFLYDVRMDGPFLGVAFNF